MKRTYFSWACIITCICLIFLYTNCKKDDNNVSDKPIDINKQSATTSDSILNKNIVIIDSTSLILTSDTVMLNKGHLEYNVIGKAPDIKVNDIIVGADNGGYIKKVTSVNQQPGKIIIESSQGTMEDVFNNASFNFTLATDDNLKATNPRSVQSFDISEQTLYHNGPLAIKLTRGLVNIGGDWNFDFDFSNSKLESFVLECKNASFSGQFDFDIKTSQVFRFDTTIVLKRIAKYFTKVITAGVVPIPVVVYMEVELRSQLSGTIESKVQEAFSINSNATMNLGLSYSNAQWQTTYNKTASSSLTVTQFNDSLKAKLELGLIPYVSFRLYRIAGPYASFGLRELVKGEITLPAGDWDFYAGAWLQTVVGARAGIFSKSWVDYNKEWNTDTMYYATPYNIIRVSGDNQLGNENEYLDKPLRVRVLDFKGGGQPKVPVYFTVTSGKGSVEKKMVLTDKDGYAQTRWKIGPESAKLQVVEVIAKKADGALIKDAPIDFAASAKPVETPTLTTNTVSAVSATTATAGGNITNDGGAPITARGVCWSTSPDPTIANSKTMDGIGSGNFTSNITGLEVNKTYYVRAYATNSKGTGYGNEVSFKTISTAINFEGNYTGSYHAITTGATGCFYINLFNQSFSNNTIEAFYGFFCTGGGRSMTGVISGNTIRLHDITSERFFNGTLNSKGNQIKGVFTYSYTSNIDSIVVSK